MYAVVGNNTLNIVDKLGHSYTLGSSGNKCNCCCPKDIKFKNNGLVKKFSGNEWEKNLYQMFNKIDVKMQISKKTYTDDKDGAYLDCTFDWFEYPTAPITGYKLSEWNDTSTISSVNGNFKHNNDVYDPKNDHTIEPGGDETFTFHDTPGIPSGQISRYLYIYIRLIPNHQCPCEEKSRKIEQLIDFDHPEKSYIKQVDEFGGSIDKELEAVKK